MIETSRPETPSTELTRFNALRHGILSRYTVLPWEDAEEYRAVVAALLAEHDPQGATEEHLVEEIAGILWRKRRLRLAEAAAYRHGLEGALASSKTAEVALVHLNIGKPTETVTDAIHATLLETQEDMAENALDEEMVRRALEVLGSERDDLYEAAVETLRGDPQVWWEETLARDPEDGQAHEDLTRADPERLRRFLTFEVLPWLQERKKEFANRLLIREQAFGELLDPDKLERLSRYEVHLDRKLERMLAMLLRLKELRQRSAL